MTLINNVDDVELSPHGIHMICGYRASRRVARLLYSIPSYQASGKAKLLHCEWVDEKVRLGKDRVGDDGAVSWRPSKQIAMKCTRFYVGVSHCFNLPPQRSGVYLSASTQLKQAKITTNFGALTARSSQNKVR